jgi:hypothetical protein
MARRLWLEAEQQTIWPAPYRLDGLPVGYSVRPTDRRGGGTGGAGVPLRRYP